MFKKIIEKLCGRSGSAKDIETPSDTDLRSGTLPEAPPTINKARLDHIEALIGEFGGEAQTAMLETLRYRTIAIAKIATGYDITSVQTSQWGVKLSRARLDLSGNMEWSLGPKSVDDILDEITKTRAMGKYSSFRDMRNANEEA